MLLLWAQAAFAQWSVAPLARTHATLAEVYADPLVGPGDTVVLPGGTLTEGLPLVLDKRLRWRGDGTTRVEVSQPFLVVQWTAFEALTLVGLDARVLDVFAPVEFEDATVTQLGGAGCIDVLPGGSLLAANTRFAGCSGLDGGAVTLAWGTFDCAGCVFSDNGAGGRGGALFVDNGAIAVMTRSTFLDNKARHGGAIAVSGTGQVWLDGSYLGNNVAEEVGGAVAVIGAARVYSRFSTFEGNEAADGGAVGCNWVGRCWLRLEDSQFVSNTVTGEGGHLFGIQDEHVVVRRSSFRDGSAGEDGGAISVNGSTVKFEDVVLEGNVAGDDGGGLHLTNSAVRLSRLAACDNVAGDSGGGLYLRSETVGTNLTLLRNSSGRQGGGLRVQADSDLSFVTLAGNAGGPGASAIDVSGDAEVTVSDAVLVGHEGVLVAQTLGAIDLVVGSLTLRRVALWDNARGIPDKVAQFRLFTLGAPPFVVPPTCTVPIPFLDGPLTDLGDGFDLDGSPADLGATGGPGADPALWADDDVDGVAAMWDCDPMNAAVSPFAEEVPGNGIDDDCDGTSAPGPGLADPDRNTTAVIVGVRGGACTCGQTPMLPPMLPPTLLLAVGIVRRRLRPTVARGNHGIGAALDRAVRVSKGPT